MIAKSYLVYLNKLRDDYNNTYHNYIDKNPIDEDFSAFFKKIGQNIKP